MSTGPLRSRLPAALRIVVLALLCAGFLVLRPDRGEEAKEVVWVGGADADRARPAPEDDGGEAGAGRGEGAGVADLVAALRDPMPPGLVVRAAAAPPTVAELEVLAAAGARSPVVAALPAGVPRLRVAPPREARAGRAAALPFTVRGAPGDTLLVRLLDEAGALDSLPVAVGAGGEGAGAFRVRPARAGWHAWRVVAAGESLATGAWVRAAAPLRVLVASGPPDWETRFALRSLEEAGAVVDVAWPLGRGLAVASGRAALPADVEALRGYDAVLLFPGARPTHARLRALERYAAEAGGGVLVAGEDAAPAALGVAEGWGSPREVGADALAWRLPAELAPLPPAPLRTAAVALGPLRAGAVGVAGDLLALRALGRGRVAALGLRETWRWRMEEGRIVEHREFWRSLAEWLAAGARDTLVVEVDSPIGPPGTPVAVRVRGGAAPAPPGLALVRPDGRREALPLAAEAGVAGAFAARFLPDLSGTYLLAIGDSALAAFHATPEADPAADAWARLALLAARSGGAALPADSVEAWLAARAPARGATPGRAWLPPLLFALTALAALLEWTIRRLRGRA